MADDTLTSAATHGAALLGGGGMSAWVVRLIFGGFNKRLDDIEKTLKELVEKSDNRHEKLIVELAEVKRDAQAAHRRIDELLTKRRRP